jgi:hypothetical protein
VLPRCRRRPGSSPHRGDTGDDRKNLEPVLSEQLEFRRSELLTDVLRRRLCSICSRLPAGQFIRSEIRDVIPKFVLGNLFADLGKNGAGKQRDGCEQGKTAEELHVVF